jgi:hypothetical protein
VSFSPVQSSGTDAFGSAVTPGNLLVAWIAHERVGSIISPDAVSDSVGNGPGGNYTLLGTATVSAGTHFVASIYAAIASTGGTGITVSLSPSASSLVIATAEFSCSSGVPTLESSSPAEATGSGTSLSSGAQTLIGTSDLVLAIGTAVSTGQTWTPGGSLTSIFSSPGSSGVSSILAAYQVGVGAGSFTATMSDTVSSGWACVAVAFRAALTGMFATEAHDSFSGSGSFLTNTTSAVTERTDSFSGSAHFSDLGSMAHTESGDSFSGSSKFLAPASMAKTEAHDAFSASGHFATSASMAPTESRDAFTGTGIGPTASLAATEHGDTFSGTALVAGNATMATTERHDTMSCFAMVSPFLRARESGDVFSGSGTSTTSTSMMAVTNNSDTFVGTAGFTFDTVAGLHPTEHGDIAAFVGTQSSSASMSVVERGDSFVGTSSVHVAATMSATESGDVMRAGNETIIYTVYSNTGAGDPINYSDPIDVTAGLTYTTGPLSFPSTWSFGVRASWAISGLQEQNVDAVTTIVLNALGQDITNTPPAPIGLRAFATAGGTIRVEWTEPPTSTAKTPVGFHVYLGSPTVNYGTIAATVLFSTGLAGSFVANIGPLTNGTTYLVGVRAFNAVSEETNTNTVSVTADGTGPSAVVDLTAIAVT